MTDLDYSRETLDYVDQVHLFDQHKDNDPIPFPSKKSNKRKRSTRKERRQHREEDEQKRNNLHLGKVKPKTDNQKLIFDEYDANQNILIHGYAGTGKTFCAIYKAMQDVMNEDSKFEKLIIIRSAVATRDLGFLPGDEKKKIEVFERPFKPIFAELFHNKNAYDILTKKEKVSFDSTSFQRGLTFNNAIVIVDEAQSMVDHEVNTIMTRMGENSKVVICGDYRQNDLSKGREVSYMPSLIKIAMKMNSFSVIDMKEEDIVRGPFVKDWIITKERLGL